MSASRLTTVFRFVCAHCAQPNEHRERHLPTIRPHLVSTKCGHCHKLNWFGSLTGMIVDEIASDKPAETAGPSTAN